MPQERLTNIKLLITDVDGVLTDGGIYITENGDELKKFNAKDGRGIIDLGKTGFKVGIISHSANVKLIKSRAKRMRVPLVYAGDEDKLVILKQWCDELDIRLKDVAFIGDDTNDLRVMSEVGVIACPADAHRSVKSIAHIILERKGGEGCVREFIDDYLLPAL
ncbi:MAG: HAD hydrolase family protein [Bacteroidota bacterium]